MTATLSADHRAGDGAQAAQFLATFRDRLDGTADEAIALPGGKGLMRAVASMTGPTAHSDDNSTGWSGRE